MVREMTKKTKRFSLEESDAIEENERILESGSLQRKENREKNKEENMDQVPVSGEDKPMTSTTTSVAQPVAKATNGIVVDVPIDDYMALIQMKIMTRRTLKDLALQAIHEFVERNK